MPRLPRLLQAAFRLGLLAAAAWLIRDQRRLRDLAAHPEPALDEVRADLPGAARLEPDDSGRGGVRVLDPSGRRVGHAVRTRPACDRVLGYRGPTDLLVVFDEHDVVRSVRIRDSADTREHVSDIRSHPGFLSGWNGRTWSELAAGGAPEVEGVSGATMTSLAIAESLSARLGADRPPPGPRVRLGPRDAILLPVLGAGVFIGLWNFRGRVRVRRIYLVLVVVVPGFLLAEMPTLQQLLGWAASGIPWAAGAGTLILAGTAFLAPAATGRNVYCAQVCPYGALQELAGPAPGTRVRPSEGWKRGLAVLPVLLLGAGVVAAFLGLPVELADLEPFEAFQVPAAGWASLLLAGAGLLASLRIPRAYCRFGCPTGLLLNLGRAPGRPSPADAGLVLVVLLLLALRLLPGGAP